MKNIIYIKSAKTGGTSIEKALENRIVYYKEYRKNPSLEDGQILCIQSDLVFLSRKGHPKIWEDSHIFTVVRDPYSRVASGYAYHPYARNFTLSQILNFPEPEPSIYTVFWKEELPKTVWDDYSLYNHVLSKQSDFLFENENPLFDTLLRFENLNEDFSNFIKENGIDGVKLEHLNKGNQKYVLSESERRQISKRFSLDFELFNYDI